MGGRPKLASFFPDFKLEDEIEVWCDYAMGFPGTRETPAEKAGFIPVVVKFRGIDITEVLTDEELDQIAEKCNEGE